VDLMSSTMTKTAALIPSTFGMPTSGSAPVAGLGCPVVALGAADARVLATPDVRDRKFAGATGSIVSQGKAYFPGTSAWRPPGC
jgi:hypothetical protein